MAHLDIIPLARKPAAEKVADQIRELIRSGSLKAGDALPSENNLASAFRVSRPVVREALRGLQILGILETRQGGRCVVTDLDVSRMLAPLQLAMALSDANVDRLHEARLMIECGLVRMGAADLSPDELERLRALVQAGYDAVSDPVAFRVVDLEFHSVLMGTAKNPFLEVIARSLYQLGMEYRRLASETNGVIERSASEHDAIVRALVDRDGEKAVEAMREHLTSIHETTVAAMRTSAATRAAKPLAAPRLDSSAA